MTFDEQEVLRRFHRALVREIQVSHPEGLTAPFSVAEIYQNLVPYRTHRDELGVEMNADYEYALLRLLAGEGDYLGLESHTARQEIREELDSPNPNTGLYRDFAAADVRLNPELLEVGFLDEIAGEAAARMEELGGQGSQEDNAEGHLVDAEHEGETVAPGDEGSEEESSESEDEGEEQGFLAEVPEDGSASEVIEEEDLVEAMEATDIPTEGDGDAGTGGEENGRPPFETCPWCRENLPQRPGVSFCPFCGSNVQLVPCPACGEELELNWRFCIACGTEVAS
jgi:hypothetical protein